MNWDSPVTGSWNIQEELRKVRSRATEEMLRTRPSSKIDWSALASVYEGGPSLLCTGEVGGAKDKFSNFTQLVDVPLTWGSAATTSGLTGVFFTCRRETILTVAVINSAITCEFFVK